MSTIQLLGIDRMSPDERLRLIEDIWDSLAQGKQCDIPESHKEELDRRLADADANPAAGIPWEEARAQLRSGQ